MLQSQSPKLSPFEFKPELVLTMRFVSTGCRSD